MASRYFVMSLLFAALVIAAALLARPAMAQPSASLGTDWAGSVRCDIRATAQGYAHEERQTWTLTGGAPTSQGAFSVYPAAWTVTGQGTHDRTRNASRRVAQWSAAVPGANPPVSAPVALSVAPVTGIVSAQLWHSQLARPGGYTGTEQYFNDGVPQSQGRLVATVYEIQFPRISGDPGTRRLSGYTNYEVKTQVGPLQPLAESQVTIACVWELARGSAGPLPPSTIPDVPSSGATSATTPPASTTPPGSNTGTPPAGSTTPSSTTTATALSPRSIAVTGFTATGSGGSVSPRNLALAGFTAVGSAGSVSPRSIAVSGFTARGEAASVPPRAITVTGWTAVGVATAPRGRNE